VALLSTRLQPFTDCPRPNRRVDSDGTLTITANYGPGKVPDKVGFILDNRPSPRA